MLNRQLSEEEKVSIKRFGSRYFSLVRSSTASIFFGDVLQGFRGSTTTNESGSQCLEANSEVGEAVLVPSWYFLCVCNR